MPNRTIVIPRVEKDGTPILFFPEFDANYGRIVIYVRVGQHGEADLEYYRTTKPDHKNACADLIREHESFPDSTPHVLRKRLNMDVLRNAWKRRLGL